MPYTQVASIDEVPPGSLLEIVRADRLYALCNVNGEIRAISGVCPHQRAPLGQGVLEGSLVTCPWHLWQFDTITGACVFSEHIRIPIYPVRIEAGRILVDLPDSLSDHA